MEFFSKLSLTSLISMHWSIVPSFRLTLDILFMKFALEKQHFLPVRQMLGEMAQVQYSTATSSADLTLRLRFSQLLQKFGFISSWVKSS